MRRGSVQLCQLLRNLLKELLVKNSSFSLVVAKNKKEKEINHHRKSNTSCLPFYGALKAA